MRRVISEWIGWANVANLLVATKSGRAVLRTVAKPLGWAARKVNPLLRKNTTVGEKMDQAKAKAADKFERIDKAFNVRKNMDLGSNMMFRYRLSAVIGIARKAAPKVFVKGTKACKNSMWLAVVVFLATDKTAHRYAKSLWTKVRSLKVDVTLQAEPTVVYGPEAPAENVAYQANRRDRRAAAKAAAKAAGRKVTPTDEPAAAAA